MNKKFVLNRYNFFVFTSTLFTFILRLHVHTLGVYKRLKKQLINRFLGLFYELFLWGFGKVLRYWGAKVQRFRWRKRGGLGWKTVLFLRVKLNFCTYLLLFFTNFQWFFGDFGLNFIVFEPFFLRFLLKMDQKSVKMSQKKGPHRFQKTSASFYKIIRTFFIKHPHLFWVENAVITA